MNEADIRKYAEMMQELGLTGLEITEDNKKIRLERMAAPAQTAVINAAPAVPTSAPAPIENTDFISVKSPIIGVFYAAPAENAEPYVKVGDQVKKGQTLCLIESMKLMNAITADQDGVISEICVTNGSIVEFGTELFRIKR